MLKKICSIILVFSIFSLTLLGTVKTSEAALPDSVIKLSKPLLSRLVTLIVAGLNLETITEAEDIGRRYYESGITCPDWDAEGNLTIDVQAIDNARNWLDATYPGLPALIEVDGGLSYIGQTLPAIEDYTPNHSERTLFQDQNFSTTGLYQINILDFGSLKTWMTYEEGTITPLLPFPTRPGSYNSYLIVSDPIRLIQWTQVPYNLIYKDGNGLYSTENATYKIYNLTSDNTWLLDQTMNYKTLTSNFNGVFYESNKTVYATYSCNTTLSATAREQPVVNYNDCIMSLSDGETSSHYDLNMSMNSAFASWGYPGGSSNIVYPYSSYLGLYNQMRWNISSNPSVSVQGKQDLTVWPSFHDLTYGWTDYDQVPTFTFDATSGTNINLTIDASPMSTIQAQMQYYGSYPKTDLTFVDKLTTEFVTGQPTNWDQINNIRTNPVPTTDEPPPDPDEPPTDVLTSLTNIITKITDLPKNIVNEFTTVNPGDSIDFTKLQVAGDLFTSKFPFCLPWDLKNMLSSFGSGSTTAPKIPIGIGELRTDIDMAQFNSIASTARVLELSLFNLALVFGTRKLLGGAA